MMKLIKLIVLITSIGWLTAFTLKSADTGYRIGDSIADFSLKNTDDTMVSLADYPAAKGFIIIFTCNTCPYSIANEDRIIALDKKYKTKGFLVIAINPNDPVAVPDDSFEKMKVRAQEKGFTFPYLLDVGQKVYPKFGATKTPEVFIVTQDDLKVKYIGAVDNSSRDATKVTERYVENAVDALLSDEKIEKTKTSAIGCSIKV
ncbi:MAG: peroxiredoxin [Polaribacter sp.]|jgi:peroxiredoxin